MIPEIVLIIAAIIIFAVLIFLPFIGRRLKLFSPNVVENQLHSALMRWLLYSVIGFVWILAKVHFPGVEASITYGYDNKFGYVVRAAYWKCRVHELGKDVIIDVGAKAVGWNNVSIGDNSWIDRNVILETGVVDKTKFMIHVKKKSSLVSEGELKIGKGCHISKNAVIQSCGGVFIGDFTGIASGAKIYSLSHHYKNMNGANGVIYKFTPLAPPHEQSLIEGPVVLEGNNALGLNSVILPGVTIGKNSWIGVCSYVNQDIPPDCIAVGCPAKVTKMLRDKSEGLK